jgi:hypothetical protein
MINGLMIDILLENNNNFNKMKVKNVKLIVEDETPFLEISGYVDNFILEKKYNVFAQYKIANHLKLKNITDIQNNDSMVLEGFGFKLTIDYEKPSTLEVKYKANLLYIFLYDF